MAGCCFMLSLLVLAVMPCLFLPLAVYAVPTYPEQLQGLVFQGLVIGCTFVQILAAAGPIATGLVHAALNLPELLGNAVDAMQASLGEKISELIKSMLGGNSSQLLLSGAINVVTGILGQAIKTATKIIDIKVLVPRFMTDLTALGPILGIVLFLLYLTNIFPLLMLGFPYKLGIVTGGTTGLMVGLFISSLMAHKIALIFLLVVQVVLNFAFQTLLAGLIPTETLDSGLKVLLGSHAPSMTALKTSLIGLCYLNLTSPPQRSRKRRFSEAVAAAAGEVGPRLKRLRTGPREALREAAGATLEAAAAGGAGCCGGLRRAPAAAAGATAAAGQATLEKVKATIRTGVQLLTALPATVVTYVRWLWGVIRAVPATALLLCRMVWTWTMSCLRCCMCCFGMCAEYLVMLAVVAALISYCWKNGYIEALKVSMSPILGITNKALKTVKATAEAFR